ncbi:unnamed protein product [Vitrella brassicaformis CCMP3155]|uniref:FHA domain-containing protein n=4 Tax=Vitrella brassicaformis TaxID=1169539 RepID=A0A0G4EPC0_VITBC|nr:unnamed protein product [Vitrella brassicaformis CCMP3155]|eukprot:CEL99465.1 unnamed protein product [Vitrella brassicaformis CCMP3155]
MAVMLEFRRWDPREFAASRSPAGVEREEAQPVLTLPLHDFSGVTVGRSLPFPPKQRPAGCVALAHWSVSVTHAFIRVLPWPDEQGFIGEIMDLASANGTYVDGYRLEPHSPWPLKEGSIVRFGGCPLIASLKVDSHPSAHQSECEYVLTFGSPSGSFSSTRKRKRSRGLQAIRGAAGRGCGSRSESDDSGAGGRTMRLSQSEKTLVSPVHRGLMQRRHRFVAAPERFPPLPPTVLSSFFSPPLQNAFQPPQEAKGDQAGRPEEDEKAGMIVDRKDEISGIPSEFLRHVLLQGLSHLTVERHMKTLPDVLGIHAPAMALPGAMSLKWPPPSKPATDRSRLIATREDAVMLRRVLRLWRTALENNAPQVPSLQEAMDTNDASGVSLAELKGAAEYLQQFETLQMGVFGELKRQVTAHDRERGRVVGELAQLSLSILQQYDALLDTSVQYCEYLESRLTTTSVPPEDDLSPASGAEPHLSAPLPPPSPPLTPVSQQQRQEQQQQPPTPGKSVMQSSSKGKAKGKERRSVLFSSAMDAAAAEGFGDGAVSMSFPMPSGEEWGSLAQQDDMASSHRSSRKSGDLVGQASAKRSLRLPEPDEDSLVFTEEPSQRSIVVGDVGTSVTVSQAGEGAVFGNDDFEAPEKLSFANVTQQSTRLTKKMTMHLESVSSRIDTLMTELSKAKVYDEDEEETEHAEERETHRSGKTPPLAADAGMAAAPAAIEKAHFDKYQMREILRKKGVQLRHPGLQHATGKLMSAVSEWHMPSIDERVKVLEADAVQLWRRCEGYEMKYLTDFLTELEVKEIGSSKTLLRDFVSRCDVRIMRKLLTDMQWPRPPIFDDARDLLDSIGLQIFQKFDDDEDGILASDDFEELCTRLRDVVQIVYPRFALTREMIHNLRTQLESQYNHGLSRGMIDAILQEVCLLVRFVSTGLSRVDQAREDDLGETEELFKRLKGDDKARLLGFSVVRRVVILLREQLQRLLPVDMSIQWLESIENGLTFSEAYDLFSPFVRLRRLLLEGYGMPCKATQVSELEIDDGVQAEHKRSMQEVKAKPGSAKVDLFEDAATKAISWLNPTPLWSLQKMLDVISAVWFDKILADTLADLQNSPRLSIHDFLIDFVACRVLTPMATERQLAVLIANALTHKDSHLRVRLFLKLLGMLEETPVGLIDFVLSALAEIQPLVLDREEGKLFPSRQNACLLLEHGKEVAAKVMSSNQSSHKWMKLSDAGLQLLTRKIDAVRSTMRIAGEKTTVIDVDELLSVLSSTWLSERDRRRTLLAALFTSGPQDESINAGSDVRELAFAISLLKAPKPDAAQRAAERRASVVAASVASRRRSSAVVAAEQLWSDLPTWSHAEWPTVSRALQIYREALARHIFDLKGKGEPLAAKPTVSVLHLADALLDVDSDLTCLEARVPELPSSELVEQFEAAWNQSKSLFNDHIGMLEMRANSDGIGMPGDFVKDNIRRLRSRMTRAQKLLDATSRSRQVSPARDTRLLPFPPRPAEDKQGGKFFQLIQDALWAESQGLHTAEGEQKMEELRRAAAAMEQEAAPSLYFTNALLQKDLEGFAAQIPDYGEAKSGNRKQKAASLLRTQLGFLCPAFTLSMHHAVESLAVLTMLKEDQQGFPPSSADGVSHAYGSVSESVGGLDDQSMDATSKRRPAVALPKQGGDDSDSGDSGA